LIGGGWGCVHPETNNHLFCLQSVELQIVLSAPGHQMVRLPPVGAYNPTRDKSNEGGVTLRFLDEKCLTNGIHYYYYLLLFANFRSLTDW